jgi:hypothetical protein
LPVVSRKLRNRAPPQASLALGAPFTPYSLAISDEGMPVLNLRKDPTMSHVDESDRYLLVNAPDQRAHRDRVGECASVKRLGLVNKAEEPSSYEAVFPPCSCLVLQQEGADCRIAGVEGQEKEVAQRIKWFDCAASTGLRSKKCDGGDETLGLFVLKRPAGAERGVRVGAIAKNPAYAAR